MKKNELGDRPHKEKEPPTMARDGSFGQKEVPYSIGRGRLGRGKGLSSGADGAPARGKRAAHAGLCGLCGFEIGLHLPPLPKRKSDGRGFASSVGRAHPF